MSEKKTKKPATRENPGLQRDTTSTNRSNPELSWTTGWDCLTMITDFHHLENRELIKSYTVKKWRGINYLGSRSKNRNSCETQPLRIHSLMQCILIFYSFTVMCLLVYPVPKTLPAW